MNIDVLKESNPDRNCNEDIVALVVTRRSTSRVETEGPFLSVDATVEPFKLDFMPQHLSQRLEFTEENVNKVLTVSRTQSDQSVEQPGYRQP